MQVQSITPRTMLVSATAKQAAPAPVSKPGAPLPYTGRMNFVSRDGAYGWISSDKFRSVFIWRTSLEKPADLKVGQLINYDARITGWDPNHVEAFRARFV